MRRHKSHVRDAPFVEYHVACGRRISMCGSKSVLTYVLVSVLLAFVVLWSCGPRVGPGYPLSAFAPPLSIHFLTFALN